MALMRTKPEEHKIHKGFVLQNNRSTSKWNSIEGFESLYTGRHKQPKPSNINYLFYDIKYISSVPHLRIYILLTLYRFSN